MKSKEKEFSFLHRGGVKKQNRLLLLINCLFLSTCYYVVLAQTPKPTPDFSTQAAGHLGFAKELLEEGSKDSMLASVEDFELAKKLFQKSGDKKFESICLDYLANVTLENWGNFLFILLL